MDAYSTKNKITFSYITLKGRNDAPRRIVANFAGLFNKEAEQIGWGTNDLSACETALKYQVYLHQYYKEKYYDLLKNLSNAGLILKTEEQESE